MCDWGQVCLKRTSDECECDCGLQDLGLQSMMTMFVDHSMFWKVESRVDSGIDVTGINRYIFENVMEKIS